MMDQIVFKGERVDDLQYQGLRIIQNAGLYRFTMDAVLLADFASVHSGDTAVDLGTGVGILPILMSAKCVRTFFHGFEVQAKLADMAARSVILNGLSERIRIYAKDIKEAVDVLGYGSVRLVVTNPPYGKYHAASANEMASLSDVIAKFEHSGCLRDFVDTASKLLQVKGRFAVIYPVNRLLELTDQMRSARIEPKRIRMVHPKIDRAPTVCLVEGVKHGNAGLRIMPPLIVYHQDNTLTDEVKKIYHQHSNTA